MIILLKSNKLNKEIATRLVRQSVTANEVETIMEYSNVNFTGITDTHLTLFDLSADLEEQELLNEGGIIELLQKKGDVFPDSIKSIDLIYSDVDMETGLSQQARDISFYFRQKFDNREVSVRHTALGNFDYTIVLPPYYVEKTDPNWYLYGLSEEEVNDYKERLSPSNIALDEFGKMTLDNYVEIIRGKKLSPQWQGVDIQSFLAKPGQREYANFISITENEEEMSSVDSDVFSSFEDSELDKSESDHTPLLKRHKRLFDLVRESKEVTADVDKKAKIVVDEKTNSIALVLPLSADTRAFMQRMQEEYNGLKHPLSTTKVSP